MIDRPAIGVGMIGYAFMGRAHSHAWRNVARVFEVPLEPIMTVICGRSPDAVKSAASMLGWREHDRRHPHGQHEREHDDR